MMTIMIPNKMAAPTMISINSVVSKPLSDPDEPGKKKL